MPAHRNIPDASTLKTMSIKLTHQQIADKIFDDTGVRVARSTVSAALSRANKTDRVRYISTIPWTPIKNEHNHHYALTMLRANARRIAGKPLTEDQNQRLDSWLKRMVDENCVLGYRYESPDGFYYLRRKPEDGESLTRL